VLLLGRNTEETKNYIGKKVEIMEDNFYQNNIKTVSPNIDFFLSIKKQNNRRSTVKSYYYILNQFYEVTGTDIVDDKSLKKYLTHLQGISDNTYNLRLTVIKTFARWLKRRGLIEDEVFLQDYEPISNPEEVRKRKKYSEEEVKRFLEIKPRWLHYVLFLGFYFGLRINEIARLKITDINIEDQYIELRPEVQKRGKKDFTAIPDILYSKFIEMVNWRRGLLSNVDFLLINQRGNQITSNALTIHLSNKLKLIDSEFRYHHMRYTAAWRAYGQTQDIYAAQRLLRHSSPVQTVKYLRVQKEHVLKYQREQMEKIYENVIL